MFRKSMEEDRIVDKRLPPVTMTVRSFARLNVRMTSALSGFTRFFIISRPKNCMSFSTSPLWRNTPTDSLRF